MFFKKTKFVFLSVLILFLFFFVKSNILAIEYGGIGGRPAYPRLDNPRTESIFIHQINPSDVIDEGIKVINNSNQVKTLMIYATDDTPSTDGGFACEQLSETKDGVGSWIQLNKYEVTLKPNTNEIVGFTISIPKDVEIGEHNGCIIVQEKKDASKDAGMQLSLRTGIRVALTVPGEINRRLEVLDFNLTNKSGSIYMIQPIIKNIGNVSIDANIKIRVTNILTRKTIDYGGMYPILTNGPLSLNYEFPKPFWGGIYAARTTITYNDGMGDRVIRTQVVRFISWPQSKAIIYLSIGFVSILSIIMFFIFKRKKRKKRVISSNGCFKKKVFLKLILYFFFGIFWVFKPIGIFALNKVNNWDFTGSGSGWNVNDDYGCNICGDNGSSPSDSPFPTFAYTSNLWQGISEPKKNTASRAMIFANITAPGSSGTVKAKGKLTFTSTSALWNNTDTSWVKLAIYDSNNSSFIYSLNCISFNSNQSQTFTFSSDVGLTAGVTYTVRATMRTMSHRTTAGSATTTFDNIVVNFAPVGFISSTVPNTTNSLLTWDVSVGGSNAPGLNSTNPYKIYRDTSSPVSTYLSAGSTNVFTDTGTTGNTTYYYAIADVDSVGDTSPLSAETSILTLPGIPISPSITNIGSTGLQVGWTAPVGGAASYKIERCTGSGCSNFSQIASGVTNLYYDDASLTCDTLYRYQIRGTNISGDGGYSSIVEATTNICESGSLSVDIVDSGGNSVSSPSLALSPLSFAFSSQISWGNFGVTNEKIRVTNTTSTPGWSLSLSASPTVLWNSAGTDYDFNDPTANAVDGGDDDLFGGQLHVNPSVATITPQSGCSNTDVSLGSSSSFSEGIVNTITLLTGGSSSQTGCYWDLTGVYLSQTVPKEQPVASDYNINFVLTIVAN